MINEDNMMGKLYILDVFAEKKYQGNQLAVVSDAENLNDKKMQQIAKEMNYSETTFILGKVTDKRGFEVRIFTPENEIPFAGHPTLGTAYVIQRETMGESVDEIVLNLKVGQITVKFEEKDDKHPILWMEQKIPVFGQNFDVKVLANVLKIREEDLDSRFPVQEVSTGLPFIIVPLKNLDGLKRSKISFDAYNALIKNTKAKAILIFCPQTYKEENDLSVRMFAPFYGISEDPATGSANGCLAGYLFKHDYFGGGKVNIRMEQGYEIGRPSLLFLKAEDYKGYIRVLVGGKVFMVAKGELI